MHGTEHRHNKLRFNEILDTTNKCQNAIKDKNKPQAKVLLKLLLICKLAFQKYFVKVKSFDLENKQQT